MKFHFLPIAPLLLIATLIASCAPSARSIVLPSTDRSASSGASDAASRQILAAIPGEGTITGTAGVECRNPILAFVCVGPPGSSATLAFTAQLGPFGLQPSRCTDVTWSERVINEYLPASSAYRVMSLRKPQALGDQYFCGESEHSLTVTAPSKPGGYVYKGTSASFTVCFDDLPNPCQTATTAEGRLALISIATAAPSPAPSGSGSGGSGGGGDGSGGGSGGPCTSTAPVDMVRSRPRMPFTGVVGGGGSPGPLPSPSPVPTTTATPTPTPVPSPTPSAESSCSPGTPPPSLELTMTGTLQTVENPIDAPAYVYEDSALMALQDGGNGGVVTSSARRTTGFAGGIKVPCVGQTTIDAKAKGSAQVRINITCTPPAVATRVDVTTRRHGFNRQSDTIGSDVKTVMLCGRSACSGTIPVPVAGTGLYEIMSTYSAKTTADSATSDPFKRVIPFNEAGIPYPQYVDTRYLDRPILFPSARTSFVHCPGAIKQDAFGCYARDAAFADKLRHEYGLMGWNMAVFKYADIDAHHIHPLQWGGDNSVEDNGVFLVQHGHRSAYGPWWDQIVVPDPV